MTALKDFDRLECQGIWRASSGAQRKNVVVSVGQATLTLTGRGDTALAHWSLPAVERINPGERPALYRPGPDATDILEISDNTMIRAITKVRTAIERRRPHPGRLRFGLVSSLILVAVLLTLFWLPRAMIDYTASVVPLTKRIAIGESLLENIRRVSGKPCESLLGQQALQRLQIRLFGAQEGNIVILSSGVKQAEHLPGNIIMLNRALVEDHETVEVAAGYAIAENLRAKESDPLVRLLRDAGISASFRLLTTGDIPQQALSRYAENLLLSEPALVTERKLLDHFRIANIRSTPYAYALDISGETTIGLIEADPLRQKGGPRIISDGDWVSLQGICGE